MILHDNCRLARGQINNEAINLNMVTLQENLALLNGDVS